MKQLLVSVFILFFTPLFSQWNLIPTGTNDEITGIDFASANVAYYSRGIPSGTLYKSTDSGLNWSNTGKVFPYFKNIQCMSEDTLQVQEYMSFNYTYNGGANWQTATVNGGSSLNEFFAFHFPSFQTGYATGLNFNWDSLLVFKTTNGGQTWNLIKQIDGYYYADIFFTNDVTGFMATDGYIYKTIDGGVTWTPKYTQMGVAPVRIFFPSPTVGYAISELGDFFKSTDAGETWTLYNSVLYQNDPISTSSDLYFINNDTGYVTSEYVGSGVPAIQYTYNGGLNWSVGLAGTNGLQCISLYSKSLGLAGGALGELRRLGDQTTLIAENTLEDFQLMQLPEFLIFSFHSDAEKIVTIYDLSGKVIFSQTVSGTRLSMETTGFSSGLFIVSVTENDFTRSKKIAIVNE